MASNKKQTILVWYKSFLFTRNCTLNNNFPQLKKGHFRVPPGLRFKTRVGAQPLIRKSFFILMQIKLIYAPSLILKTFWNSEVAYFMDTIV